MNKLLNFPHNYVILDIEMTGLNLEKDSIIEIAGLKIIENNIESTFSTLIKPKDYTLKEEITNLTGITEEMLLSAPNFNEIAINLLKFIGTVPIIGHNILFDIQFLNKTLKEHDYPTLNNDYVDTLPLSQKLFPEFIHHKLTDIALYYNINTIGAHRALQDCYITKECFDKMGETMNRSFPCEKAFIESFSTTGRRLKAEYIQPFIPTIDLTILPHPFFENQLSTQNQINIQNQLLTTNQGTIENQLLASNQRTTQDQLIASNQPTVQKHSINTSTYRNNTLCINNKQFSTFHKKTFVFTGILKQMSRREAMTWIANLGGINEDKLTTKTDFLIVGTKEIEIITNKDNVLSTKEKKALRYQEEGFPIQILSECAFYKLINAIF